VIVLFAGLPPLANPSDGQMFPFHALIHAFFFTNGMQFPNGKSHFFASGVASFSLSGISIFYHPFLVDTLIPPSF